jgi:hypothetical protein
MAKLSGTEVPLSILPLPNVLKLENNILPLIIPDSEDSPKEIHKDNHVDSPKACREETHEDSPKESHEDNYVDSPKACREEIHKDSPYNLALSKTLRNQSNYIFTFSKLYKEDKVLVKSPKRAIAITPKININEQLSESIVEISIDNCLIPPEIVSIEYKYENKMLDKKIGKDFNNDFNNDLNKNFNNDFNNDLNKNLNKNLNNDLTNDLTNDLDSANNFKAQIQNTKLYRSNYASYCILQ